MLAAISKPVLAVLFASVAVTTATALSQTVGRNASAVAVRPTPPGGCGSNC